MGSDSTSGHDELLEQAHLALLRHQNEAAVQLLQRLLAAEPHNVAALQLLEQALPASADPATQYIELEAAPAPDLAGRFGLQYGARVGVWWGLSRVAVMLLSHFVDVMFGDHAPWLSRLLSLGLVYVAAGALIFGMLGRGVARSRVPAYWCDWLGLLVGLCEGLGWILWKDSLPRAAPWARQTFDSKGLVGAAIYAAWTSRLAAGLLADAITERQNGLEDSPSTRSVWNALRRRGWRMGPPSGWGDR